MRKILTVIFVLFCFSGFGQSHDTVGTGSHVWVERGGTSFQKFLEVPLQKPGFTKVDSVGCVYYDTTLHQLFVHNGSVWTPVTGSGGGAGTVTSITAGTGLAGGTITTSGTISMPNTGTAGTYGSATVIPQFTTDAQGRVVAVTTVTATPAATFITGKQNVTAGSTKITLGGTPTGSVLNAFSVDVNTGVSYAWSGAQTFTGTVSLPSAITFGTVTVTAPNHSCTVDNLTTSTTTSNGYFKGVGGLGTFVTSVPLATDVTGNLSVNNLLC